MIILIDIEKAFDKIQHFIIIKTVNKLEIEGDFLNMIKGISLKKKKPTVNITLDGGTLKAFPLRPRAR